MGAETIFGYRQEDALGRTLDLIIPAPGRARHREGQRIVMRNGVTRYGRGTLATLEAAAQLLRRASV